MQALEIILSSVSVSGQVCVLEIIPINVCCTHKSVYLTTF